MFGYIMVNKGDLKIREFEVYQSFYCGLCRKLKERYGMVGQMTLSYDLTFLTILLTGLYEPHNRRGTTHCAVHPLKKQPIMVNKFSEYAADMSILLTYYKCMDDWNDEHKVDRLFYGKLLKRKFGGLEASYSKKVDRVKELLNEMSVFEKEKEQDLDKMAGLFGEVMAEMMAYREDEWEEGLRRMGFYLGKYIYLCDAYEDLEEDIAKDNYNPLRSFCEKEYFEEDCERILTMVAAECSKEFERLPIIEYTPILRNILYSGIWARYERTRKRREEGKSGKAADKRRKE